MTMKIANAAAAYAAAGKISGPGMAPRGEAGGGFADMVRDAAENVVGTLQKGEATTMQALSGKVDLGEVVTAVSNAEVTLQTVAALRDRVVAAYQEILRMPI
jgi:flagellar hook-basal body complex protein FliE